MSAERTVWKRGEVLGHLISNLVRIMVPRSITHRQSPWHANGVNQENDHRRVLHPHRPGARHPGPQGDRKDLAHSKSNAFQLRPNPIQSYPYPTQPNPMESKCNPILSNMFPPLPWGESGCGPCVRICYLCVYIGLEDTARHIGGKMAVSPLA